MACELLCFAAGILLENFASINMKRFRSRNAVWFVVVLLLGYVPALSAQDSADVPVPLPPVEARPPVQIQPFISTTPP